MDVDGLTSVLVTIDDFVWGPFLLIPLLLGTGLYLTIRLTGLQFRQLGHALRLAFRDRTDQGAEGDISHYQALTTALAATVGVGNIVGVATAISIGGPGALFWMWVTALLGMASKYSEAFMAVRFRKVDAHGEMSGGPQYYLERAISGGLGKFLALFFAIAAVFASFGIGNLTQANAVSAQMNNSFGVPTWVMGLIMAVFAATVLIGGIKSIGRVTAAFVPVMIVFYLVGGTIILIMNITAIPQALGEVFSNAFTPTGAVGGFAGAALAKGIQMGVARGIFSNESGMGSAAIAAAAAQTRHPVRQGLVSMTQTFIDTIIVVTMTGLTIITTGVWHGIDPDTNKQFSAGIMTAKAFEHGLPGQWGHYVVTLSLVAFAFSTILGWAYYGERCMERLFGIKGVTPYRVVFSIVVFIGAVTELTLVWTAADILNGLMALPNLIGLLICSGLIARETRAYLKVDPDLRNEPEASTLHGIDELVAAGTQPRDTPRG